MLAHLKAVPVLPEELRKIVDDVDLFFSGNSDVMAYAAAARDLARNDPDKMEALMFRLRAVLRFVAEEEAPRLDNSIPDGSVLVPEEIFKAAAVHPLSMRDDRPGFDPKTFLARVLDLADLEEIG